MPRRLSLIILLCFLALGAGAQETATLTFVGDIMLGGGVEKAARAAGGTGALLAGVRATLRGDDLTVGNLECPVSTRGTAVDKKYTFRASPRMLPGLRKAGVEAVTLANNHVLDYDRPAFLDTLDHLRDYGLLGFGAGRNVDDAFRPVLLTVRGQRIALLGASRVYPNAGWAAGARHPGVASVYNPARLKQAIRAAAKQVDIVIVYLHWGVERATTPERYQRQLGRACIEAGADLVVGSHPHVLQGFEYYGGRLIAYSLGNFLFTNGVKSSAMLQVTCAEGKVTGARLLPCTSGRYRVAPVQAPRARAAALAALQARSFGVRLDADGTLRAIQ